MDAEDSDFSCVECRLFLDVWPLDGMQVIVVSFVFVTPIISSLSAQSSCSHSQSRWCLFLYAPGWFVPSISPAYLLPPSCCSASMDHTHHGANPNSTMTRMPTCSQTGQCMFIAAGVSKYCHPQPASHLLSFPSSRKQALLILVVR